MVEVIKGFWLIFVIGWKFKVLRMDKGSEFKNKWVKLFLKKEEVYLIYIESEIKSNFVECGI